MDNNILGLITNLLKQNTVSTSSSNISQDDFNQNIPPNVTSQYPYGDFPFKYTKSGQEYLKNRAMSNYYSDSINQSKQNVTTEKLSPNEPSLSNINLQDLLPLISTLSHNKDSSSTNPVNLLKLLSPILFKDNPDLIKMLDYVKPTKPKTNSVNTLSTDRINLDDYVPIL